MIENLIVHDPGEFVNSDHSPITFTIKAVIKIPKPVKRTKYNYKKANWVALNSDLSRIDWEYILSYTDVHNAWQIFKDKLAYECNRHIPKIKVKESYQPPWYAADVFRLNKKKSTTEKCLNNQSLKITMINTAHYVSH